MSRRTSLPSRVTTVALSGTAVLALSASVLIGASGVSSAAPASPSDSSGAVSYAATKAAESAFQAAGTNADPVACQRPAPDNRVSTTIHCYTPNQIRAFYGLDPLTPQTTQGEGQTIVLVDSYGTPTGAEDLAFFAKTFNGPTPDYEAAYPLGKPGYKDPPGKGSGTSGPTAADGWAGEATLDIEWAYAIAPKAHIVLLATPPAETQGVQGLPNLMKAIDWGIDRYPSGTVFSMSFGTNEAAFASPAAAKNAFARFDQTFIRGQAKGDTFLSSSGDDGSVGRHPGAQADRHGARPGGQLPERLSLRDVGRRHPGAVRLDLEPQPGQAVQRRRQPQPALLGVDPERQLAGGVERELGVHRDRRWPLDRLPPTGIPGLGRERRRHPPWCPGRRVERGGQRRRARLLVVLPADQRRSALGRRGGTSASSPQVAALTAIGNQWRRVYGHKGPIGDLNKAIYSSSFVKSAAFSDIVPRTYGTTPSGVLQNNRIWDLGADGFVTPDPVPGYPTTVGYDLTTGWGSPQGFGYVDNLLNQP